MERVTSGPKIDALQDVMSGMIDDIKALFATPTQVLIVVLTPTLAQGNVVIGDADHEKTVEAIRVLRQTGVVTPARTVP
jgi:hypothetical protein